jgi:hypothetical protein
MSAHELDAETVWGEGLVRTEMHNLAASKTVNLDCTSWMQDK